MWATCRHDHGINWEEFQDLTLPQFEALENRRMVNVRHARFNAGLVTATLFNAHRSADSEPLEVWDFLPGFERSEEEIEAKRLHDSIRSGVKLAFTQMRGKTVQQVRQEAQRMVKRLKENGTEDAEEMVSSAFEQVIKHPYAE